MQVSQPIGVHATSPAAIERAAQVWNDAKLNAHLDAYDRAESFEEQVRENVSDEHIALAVSVVRARQDLTPADKALLDLIAEEAFELALMEAQQ